MHHLHLWNQQMVAINIAHLFIYPLNKICLKKQLKQRSWSMNKRITVEVVICMPYISICNFMHCNQNPLNILFIGRICTLMSLISDSIRMSLYFSIERYRNTSFHGTRIFIKKIMMMKLLHKPCILVLILNHIDLHHLQQLPKVQFE